MSPSSRDPTFGLYNVPEGALAEVREAGFDVVTAHRSTNTLEFLEAASQAGIQVLLPSRAFSTNKGASTRAIEAYDLHPATWGWYLIDEPDLNDVPPGRVERITRQFQRRARKPGVIVLASGHSALEYGSDCDLLMVDFYPVPWAPVSRFAKEIRLAKFARAEKPYMAVVQAFDWNYFSDVLGQTNDLRAPHIDEIRCMSYMALALEARGLFFYTYTARDWHLAETSLWPELKSLVQELRSHSALFAQPPLWWPADVDYADSERMYNEVHDGVILSRLYHLPKAAGELSPGYYFLVVNTTRETVGYSFKVPFADVGSAEFGAESLRADRWLRREYKPFEVALLGPFHNPTFKND